MKRWEEAGGRRKSRLCFISALHSFTRKREFEAEKAAHCVGLRSLKRVLTVYRELWYDFSS